MRVLYIVAICNFCSRSLRIIWIYRCIKQWAAIASRDCRVNHSLRSIFCLIVTYLSFNFFRKLNHLRTIIMKSKLSIAKLFSYISRFFYLFFCCSIANAQFINTYTDGNQKAWIDLSSKEGSGNIRRIMELVNYKHKQTFKPGYEYFSIIYQYQFDCRKNHLKFSCQLLLISIKDKEKLYSPTILRHQIIPKHEMAHQFTKP